MGLFGNKNKTEETSTEKDLRSNEEEDLLECSSCSKSFKEEDSEYEDYCQHCGDYQEDKEQCDNCEKWVESTNDNSLCQKCEGEEEVECNDCEQNFKKKDVHEKDEDTHYCKKCLAKRVEEEAVKLCVTFDNGDTLTSVYKSAEALKHYTRISNALIAKQDTLELEANSKKIIVLSKISYVQLTNTGENFDEYEQDEEEEE